jgi:hypothetical protein
MTECAPPAADFIDSAVSPAPKTSATIAACASRKI